MPASGPSQREAPLGLAAAAAGAAAAAAGVALFCAVEPVAAAGAAGFWLLTLLDCLPELVPLPARAACASKVAEDSDTPPMVISAAANRRVTNRDIVSSWATQRQKIRIEFKNRKGSQILLEPESYSKLNRL
jgi:phage tail tape-measure protein